ncbi:hypothetical protein [Paracoccus sp. SSJ]|uniref:hypothetical protein n=1 Tax=Paracoccus sp. SSJ TaxID=3050636 RepID=UPI00254CFF8C|nr:hypothetical protein [Paracoccus sp. SSJ]MDK8873215.1 hypothetical protein [Paracoccus sp. SSJ]
MRGLEPPPDDEALDYPDLETDAQPRISDADRRKLRRRARRIFDARRAVSGLDRLKPGDRARLEPLANGARLACIASESRADELAAELHADMPWMAPATEIIWRAMRRSVREGWPGLRVPPLLLDGPPGIGKSHWARRLGALLSVPSTMIDATTESASFGVVRSQRGWGGSCPGRLIVAGDLNNKPTVRWPPMLRHLGQYVDPTKIHTTIITIMRWTATTGWRRSAPRPERISCRRPNSSSVTPGSCAARYGPTSPCST